MSSKVQANHDDKVASKQESAKPTVRDRAAITEHVPLANIVQLARFNPRSLTPRDVLQLQRTIGNRAVQRLPLQARPDDLEARSSTEEATRLDHDFSQIPAHPESPSTVQAKLDLRTHGDIYEQEADCVSDEVMTMPAHPAVNGTQPLIQRFTGQPTGQTEATPASVDQALASPGKPLEPALRQDMEQRFGYDFSRVGVHSGVAAEQSARDLNARAYTVGHNIVFGAGRFAPGTQEGRRLIAHELTHVVQQSGSDGIRADSRNEQRALSPISLTFPAHVQRDEIEMEGIDVRPKGLLAAKRVKGVAGRLVALWRSKKDSTIRTLIGDMLAIVNAELRGLRVAPVVFDPNPSATEAKFRRQEWDVGINLDIALGRTVNFDDKAGSLSADDLAVIGDALYHEARHAEQAFLVARKRATTIRDPDALAKNLDMPVSIARAAILAGPPGPADPDDERIEEWSAFEPAGRHFAYWQWNEAMKKVTADILNPILNHSPRTPDEFSSMADLINRTINVLSTKWSFPYDKIVEIEKMPARKTVDTDVLAQLRRITSAFDKLVLAIDDFRAAAILLERIKSHPDESDWRILEAASKWGDIRIAQLELFLAQNDAYLAYPLEVDAERAGVAARESILAATRPARAR